MYIDLSIYVHRLTYDQFNIERMIHRVTTVITRRMNFISHIDQSSNSFINQPLEIILFLINVEKKNAHTILLKKKSKKPLLREATARSRINIDHREEIEFLTS